MAAIADPEQNYARKGSASAAEAAANLRHRKQSIQLEGLTEADKALAAQFGYKPVRQLFRHFCILQKLMLTSR